RARHRLRLEHRSGAGPTTRCGHADTLTDSEPSWSIWMKKLLMAATVMTLLAGCASVSGPRHACPLDEPQSNCASVEEVYSVAQRTPHTNVGGQKRVSVLDGHTQ